MSPLIQQALDLAIETHWSNVQQFRKGKDTPYLVHPLTVALILARAGARDEVIAAGLLHDTVEDADADHPVTLGQVEGAFGKDVAQLVGSVTEHDKSAPWADRKSQALAKVETYSNDCVLLKSADVVANDLELLADLEKCGEQQVFQRFNTDARTLLEYKLALLTQLREKWPANPLATDLALISGEIEKILTGMADRRG